MKAKKAVVIIVMPILVFMIVIGYVLYRNTLTIPTYISYEDIPKDYSIDDAIKDDCVVFKDSKLIAGKDVWKKFLSDVRWGKETMFRRAAYYSDDNGLYLQDIVYDGNTFRVYIGDDDYMEFNYINHYKEKIESSDGYKIKESYVLMSKKDATWEEVSASMLSPDVSDDIRYYHIYINYLE